MKWNVIGPLGVLQIGSRYDGAIGLRSSATMGERQKVVQSIVSRCDGNPANFSLPKKAFEPTGPAAMKGFLSVMEHMLNERDRRFIEGSSVPGHVIDHGARFMRLEGKVTLITGGYGRVGAGVNV